MLGRTVDLQHLITQRINESLLKSLNVAIGRYESMGITGIMVSCALILHYLLCYPYPYY